MWPSQGKIKETIQYTFRSNVFEDSFFGGNLVLGNSDLTKRNTLVTQIKLKETLSDFTKRKHSCDLDSTKRKKTYWNIIGTQIRKKD